MSRHQRNTTRAVSLNLLYLGYSRSCCVRSTLLCDGRRTAMFAIRPVMFIRVAAQGVADVIEPIYRAIRAGPCRTRLPVSDERWSSLIPAPRHPEDSSTGPLRSTCWFDSRLVWPENFSAVSHKQYRYTNRQAMSFLANLCSYPPNRSFD